MTHTTERPWARPGSSNPRSAVGAAFAEPARQYHLRGTPSRRKPNKSRGEPVVVETPRGRVLAGYLAQHGRELVFEKHADGRLHQLRKPQAWAIQDSALTIAVARRVRRVVIHDRSCGVWWAQVADFVRHGQVVERGYGRQVALELRWWSFSPSGRGVYDDEPAA